MPVTVYSQPSCQQCKMTYKALDKDGTPYNVVNVQEDAEAFTFITQELGYQKVPVVVAGDDHWGGFQPDKIKSIAEAAA